MLTSIDEWQMLSPDAQLQRVNDIERDHNLLRGIVGEPLEPIQPTTADQWREMLPQWRYGYLIELELDRDNLRDYLRAFYDGGSRITAGVQQLYGGCAVPELERA